MSMHTIVIVIMILFSITNFFLIMNLQIIMTEAQWILREFVAPDVTYNVLYIEYPEVVVPFELKFGFIHLLPKFNGLASEDHNKHVKEF